MKIFLFFIILLTINVSAIDQRIINAETLKCEYGDLGACASAANFTSDKEKAAKLYEKACDGWNIDSCESLANLYWDGTRITKNTARAIELYNRSCIGGNGSSCNIIAKIYEEKNEFVQAKFYFNIGCEKGDLDSCLRTVNTVKNLEKISKKINIQIQEIRKKFETSETDAKSYIACKKEDFGQCYELVKNIMFYNSGLSNEVEEEVATIACDGGHIDACVRLADPLSFGNPEKRMKLLRYACENANIYACGQGGGLYFDAGNEENNIKNKKSVMYYFYANRMFDLACVSGDKYSCDKKIELERKLDSLGWAH